MFRMNTLQRYVTSYFFSTFFLCVFGTTALFLIFDTFERMRIFLREKSSVIDAVSYMLFKIPYIVHMMIPVAVLIATLVTIGRLSQNSEITAMRACGMKLVMLLRPLLLIGAAISLGMFLLAETVLPWTSNRVEEIYYFDIKRKVEKGDFSRSNYWYRSGNTFYNVAFFDSRKSVLYQVTAYEFDPTFSLRYRVDASEIHWNGPEVGWTMKGVVETYFDPAQGVKITRFPELPLSIDETPNDFLDFQRKPETLSYFGLVRYIEKLQQEGVPVTPYLVSLAAKTSFPLVSMIVILIAFPFALTPARSGSMTVSFVAGVTIGFGYHFVHAFCTSLGAAELLPVLPAAWAANILLGSIGCYFLMGAEYK